MRNLRDGTSFGGVRARSRVGRAAMGRGADSPAPRPRGPPPADGTCRYPPWSGSYCWAPSWPPLGVSASPPGETLLLSGTFSPSKKARACHLRLLPTFPRRAFVASEARAGVAVHFTLAEESYPNHIAMPYRQWTTRPTLHRSRARDDPSTTTDTPPPRPSSRPPWPKQTTTRSGTASPTSESRCGAWEAWRCVPRLGPGSGLFPETRAARPGPLWHLLSLNTNSTSPRLPRAFLASPRVVPLRAIRRSPPPSPASSTSSRGRRTRR